MVVLLLAAVGLVLGREGDARTTRAAGQPSARSDAPAPTPSSTTGPTQGAPAASYETRTSRYALGDVALPELDVAAPVLGHVVAPVEAPGPRPLVLFLHGKHNACYAGDQLSPAWPCRPGQRAVPSYRGYSYLQEALASRGFVTVSVAANAVDGQEDVDSLDSGMTARSALVRHHLRLWSRWAKGKGVHGDRWDGTVDMDRVVLVGHSRGGEGVDRAAIDTRADSPWSVAGQVLLAPSAILRQFAPGVPTVVVLPYCDGDLNPWPGQAYVDLARDVVPDPSLRSSVVVMGANHNFFNTEWTPGRSTAPAGDDAEGFYGRDHPLCGSTARGRLDDREQRGVARALVSAATRLFTGHEETGLALFDGTRRRVQGVDVHVSGLGGHRVLVRPGVDADVSGARGARVQGCTGRSDADDPRLCGRGIFWVRTPHWPFAAESPPLPAVPSPPAAEMSWTSAGARLDLTLDVPADFSGSTHLDARVVVDPARGPVQLGFRVVDDQGRAAVLTPRNEGRLNPMPGPTRLLGRLWGQTLRAPLSQLDDGDGDGSDETTVDLTAVRRVSVLASSATGRVWVLDAAGWRHGVAPPAATRVPRVDLADLAVPEGAGGPRTVDLPVTVDGELTSRARLAVQVLDLNGEPPPITVLRLRPGQRTATIPVGYVADNRREDDLELVVNTWALSGAVTGDRQGRVLIRDDD